MKQATVSLRLSCVLLAAVMLFGCAPRSEASNPAAQERAGAINGAEARTGETVRLALLPPSRESDLAALEGFLLAEGRCLYVVGRGRSGTKTTPAFLIPDATWDAEKSVLLAHGKAFSSGQRVLLGGSTATDLALLPWVQKPDPSCDSSGVWITGSIIALPQETGVDADRRCGSGSHHPNHHVPMLA